MEGGGAGHTCGPAPQFSLFVCAFILKGNLSSRLHTNTGSPSDTLTPCGNSSTLWRTHATTRHRAQRCLYGCAEKLNAPLFIFHCGLYCGSLFYSFHVFVLFHLPFFILIVFFCYNFMFSIFLIQLFCFCIFLT